MERQELFNALVDIAQNLTKLHNDTYKMNMEDLRWEILKNSAVLSNILSAEFGDWGEMKTGKNAELWKNYFNTQGERSTIVK